MRSVKLAEALHRRERRPHQKEVGEEIVLPARAQVAIMRSVVSEYQQRVLACADEQHREQIQDGVPIEGAERDRRGDPGPLLGGGDERLGRLKHGQLFELGRRQPLGDRSAGVVGMCDDGIDGNVLRRVLRPEEGDDPADLGEGWHRSLSRWRRRAARNHACIWGNPMTAVNPRREETPWPSRQAPRGCGLSGSRSDHQPQISPLRRPRSLAR